MGKQGLWNGDKILPHCFLCTRVNRADAILLFNVLDNYYANTRCTARLGNNEKTWSKFQFLVSRYLFTGYDKIWNISFLHRNIFSKSISYLYTSQFQYIEMQKLKTMWKILSIVENINYETTKWMLSNWLFFFLFLMEQRQREEFLQFLWNHFVQAEPRNIFKESLFYVRKYRGAPRKEGGRTVSNFEISRTDNLSFHCTTCTRNISTCCKTGRNLSIEL